MRKYKDPERQKFYKRLVELGSPEELVSHRIYGAILDAFTCGYNGLRIPPRFNSSRTIGYVAYYAGKGAKAKRAEV